MKTFIYPENLLEPTLIFVWKIKDLIIISFLAIVSFILASLGFTIVIFIIPMIYAFLTIRLGNLSLIKYLKVIIKYMINDTKPYAQI